MGDSNRKGTQEGFQEANDLPLLDVCSVCGNSPSCKLEICTSLYVCYTLIKSYRDGVPFIGRVLCTSTLGTVSSTGGVLSEYPPLLSGE